MKSELASRWAEFKREAGKTLSLLVLASLSPVLGCGKLKSGSSVHDHDEFGNPTKPTISSVSFHDFFAGVIRGTIYNPQRHGGLVEWFKDGDVATYEDGQPVISDDGTSRLVHCHKNPDGSIGYIEFRWERIK